VAVGVEEQVLTAAGPVQGDDQGPRLALRLRRLQPHGDGAGRGGQRQPELAGPARVVALPLGRRLGRLLGLAQQPGRGVVRLQHLLVSQRRQEAVQAPRRQPLDRGRLGRQPSDTLLQCGQPFLQSCDPGNGQGPQIDLHAVIVPAEPQL
jgi:hypothetical protein